MSFFLLAENAGQLMGDVADSWPLDLAQMNYL